MSKTLKNYSTHLEETIMEKVKSNEISMKPKWYFVVGSILTVTGLVGFSIGAVFLTNLTLFLLRRHGPMGQWRLEQLLTSMPIWIPILAVVCIVIGIWLLRKYDFSYKENFKLIIFGFILSVVLAAFVIDQLGLNDTWSRQGPMRRFYPRADEQGPLFQQDSVGGRGPGQGRFYRSS